MTRTMNECPCCGAPMEAYPAERVAEVVSPVMGEIVRVLQEAAGDYVLTATIANKVWGRDPHGGPNNPAVNIANAIQYNRRRMAALGWEIVGRLGPHGGYMLRVTDEARA